METRPWVSVVLLTFNGELYLREVMQALFSQKARFPYEVIVIDSGSTDGTLQILSNYPVRLETISNEEFNHGNTRNLGARLAHGEFVAYLTQSATPASEDWLERLVEPFQIDERVAAVYGLHIPRAGCDPITRRDIEEFFKMHGPMDRPTVQRLQESPDGRLVYDGDDGIVAFYSDVNSCLRKKVWEEIPYQPLDYAEDQALGRDVLAAGYWKVFQPLAAVRHSHSYPAIKYFRRQFDEYRGLRKSIGFVQQGGVTRVVAGSIRGGSVDAWYVIRQPYSLAAKLRWVTHAYAVAFLRRLAGYLAAREDRLPNRLTKALSLESSIRRAARNEEQDKSPLGKRAV